MRLSKSLHGADTHDAISKTGEISLEVWYILDSFSWGVSDNTISVVRFFRMMTIVTMAATPINPKMINPVVMAALEELSVVEGL